ncbi:SPOR domain-containing protein [Paraburkholderia sp. CNPSo 3274]|uniref:SPOR domain-containing protein n=1 Tax=Paraburkholderia sp. CNPSo 3274 TaxID=2940932 RepID=UPI0020B81D11|nr:SPOR domain-containing protein [Paraburkholderia sp. CNPSo 3274]MCP3710243.1 SPOR domain-containing protein [Paraburkholderia sp. CNPSo 3274]
MAKPRRTTKQQSKQSGGTFLGIVLGLIVGLAIAVVVALYITRAPTPFVSKVAPPAASDVSQSNEQVDPNRALQGKSPGQPVPQAAQSMPPNTAPGQTTNQSQSSGMLEEPQIVEVPPSGSNNAAANNNGVAVAPQPSTGENVTSGTAIAKKPQSASNSTSNPAQILANNPPQKPANAVPTPPAAKPGSTAPAPGDANTGYFLQVGAYKTSGDAEQQRARLAFQGFESKVTQRDAGGVTYFRVRIGPFTKFDDMNSTRQRLSDAGIDTAVIRFTKQ